MSGVWASETKTCLRIITIIIGAILFEFHCIYHSYQFSRLVCLEVKRNIIRTILCWIVWHNFYSQQHTYLSSSYRSNRLGSSQCDPYSNHRGGCLEFYYCNMVELFWWDSSLIFTTNWFSSVLWRCWFGHLACKNRPKVTYNVLSGSLSLYTTTAMAGLTSMPVMPWHGAPVGGTNFFILKSQ